MLRTSKYRYQPLAFDKLVEQPKSMVTLLDNKTNETMQLSAYEIISNKSIISEIDPNFFPLLFSVAVDDAIYAEKLLRTNLQQFTSRSLHDSD